jgi:hypothetical protein
MAHKVPILFALAPSLTASASEQVGRCTERRSAPERHAWLPAFALRAWGLDYPNHQPERAGFFTLIISPPMSNGGTTPTTVYGRAALGNRERILSCSDAKTR